MTSGRYVQLDRGWLRRRYLDENASASTIAAELGCSESTVRRALSAAGIYRDGRERGRGRYPQLADPAWLRQRHVLDGVRAEDIAAELGCDPTTVRTALRAAGIPRLGLGPRPAPAGRPRVAAPALPPGRRQHPADRHRTGLPPQGRPARPRSSRPRRHAQQPVPLRAAARPPMATPQVQPGRRHPRRTRHPDRLQHRRRTPSPDRRRHHPPSPRPTTTGRASMSQPRPR